MSVIMRLDRALTPKGLAELSCGVLFLVLLFGRTFWMQAEMPQVASEAWAQAISKEVLRLKSGFYDEVHARILAAGWVTTLANDNYNSAKNDAAIYAAATANYELKKYRQMTGYSWVVGEAYRLSARLFGWSTVSFTILFYIWLLISAFIFTTSFKEDNSAMNCMSLAIFSMCLIAISAPHIQQLHAFHNTRGWTILTLLPALHGWFACQRPDCKKFLMGAVQVLLALPACLARPTALWLPAFLLIVFCGNMLLRRNKFWVPGSPRCLAWSSGIYLGTIILSAGFVLAENSVGRKDAYTKWHSVAVGLGMSENIRNLWTEKKSHSGSWRLIEQPQDKHAYMLVHSYLKLSNRDVEFKSYTVSGGNMLVTKDFDWQSYEKHCKDAVFWLLQKSQLTDLVILGGKKVLQFIAGFWVSEWGPAWWSVPFLVLAPIYSWMIHLGRLSVYDTAVPFFLILLMLIGPIIVTYPQPHGLAEGLSAYAALVLVFTSMCISFFVGKKFPLGPPKLPSATGDKLTTGIP